MPRHAVLDATQHRDLRVITTRGVAFGDGAMSAITFPAEFRTLQAHFPIVFQKTAEGAFQPVALMGLREGENLFLQGSHWDAPVLPMSLERQPFLIGQGREGLEVHIDLDNPRVSTTAGEPLFNEFGATTPFLERMSTLLGHIHEGVSAVPGFIEALLAHDLLESFVLDVGDGGGEGGRLAGYYTIHEERVAALGPQTLGALHRAGYLMPIYMAIASLSQFRALIERSQRTIRHA